jgi:hypothetical protein
MKTELNLAGESEMFDTLYTACSYYMLSQMRIVKNAVLPEESAIAIKRINQIQDVLKQIELMPAKPN